MKKSYLLLLLALCAFCSCKKTTFINPSAETLSYPIQGGEETVTISSDGDWEVTLCPDWVKVEKQDSVLKCVVEENQSGKIREGKILLKGGDIRKSISVSQAYICTRLNAGNTNLSFEKEGGTQTVDIDTDGGDIKVDVTGNMEAKYDSGKLTVTAPANNGGTTSGKIILTCDSQRAEINVALLGAICPKCGGTGTVPCTRCGGRGYYSDDAGADYGCTRCGGSGMCYGEMDDVRNGSGRMTCPVCGGRGS